MYKKIFISSCRKFKFLQLFFLPFCINLHGYKGILFYLQEGSRPSVTLKIISWGEVALQKLIWCRAVTRKKFFRGCARIPKII